MFNEPHKVIITFSPFASWGKTLNCVSDTLQALFGKRRSPLRKWEASTKGRGWGGRGSSKAVYKPHLGASQSPQDPPSPPDSRARGKMYCNPMEQHIQGIQVHLHLKGSLMERDVNRFGLKTPQRILEKGDPLLRIVSGQSPWKQTLGGP